MPMSPEVFMGGSETVAIGGSQSHQLAEKGHVLFLSVAPAGTADILLPKVKGLPLRTYYILHFGTLLSVDFQIKNASGTVQTIYDLTHTARTLIDASEPSQWSTLPAVECTLVSAATNDGVWVLRYFGET